MTGRHFRRSGHQREPHGNGRDERKLPVDRGAGNGEKLRVHGSKTVSQAEFAKLLGRGAVEHGRDWNVMIGGRRRP